VLNVRTDGDTLSGPFLFQMLNQPAMASTLDASPQMCRYSQGLADNADLLMMAVSSLCNEPSEKILPVPGRRLPRVATREGLLL